MKKRKITSAIFLDTEKTAVKVFFKNGEIEIFGYDEKSPEIQNLLKQISEEQIERTTIDYQREEGAMYTALQAMIKGEGVLYVSDIASAFYGETDVDENDLFQLKIKIFEEPGISESKNRTLKSKIRKSKSFYDTLKYYFELKASLEQ